MNRRSIAYPYLLLGVFLFFWISIPKQISDRTRSFAVASLAPVWKWGERTLLARLPDLKQEELSRLRLENQTLRTQIDTVYEWLLSEQRIGDEIEWLAAFSEEKSVDPEKKAFFKRRADQMQKRLHRQLMAFPSRVVYRDPSSWSSSVWIDAGEEDNEALGEPLIAKNSPVVAGGFLVGVVDFVGKNQSRVRLITDSGLSPAVRAARGGAQNRELSNLVQSLQGRLAKRDDLFASKEMKESFFSQLKTLAAKSGKAEEEGYLAKGELHGSGVPFWRSRGAQLKGIGFNFNYADEEGPARDLRGRLGGSSLEEIPLLKEGDLLVTSGLDGVFPPGLPVAYVSALEPLKEGAYAYEIEASPAAFNMNDLQTVFVLPSLSSH